MHALATIFAGPTLRLSARLQSGFGRPGWIMRATARNLRPVTAGITFRNVNGYYFRSGTNTGVIPTFGTLDASLSYRLPAAFQSSMPSLSVANLFGCTAEMSTT